MSSDATLRWLAAVARDRRSESSRPLEWTFKRAKPDNMIEKITRDQLQPLALAA
jgi:hypothetical protein